MARPIPVLAVALLTLLAATAPTAAAGFLETIGKAKSEAAGFLESIGLTKSEGEKTGTYAERFEPADGGYAAIAIDRPKALSLKRSEAYGLLPSADLDAYLNRVIARLRPALPVPDVPVKAYATASLEPMAQATPDGGIFVSIALLRSFASEDALAFAMAHEIAHVLYRHHETDWFVNSEKFAAQAVTLGAQMKAAVKGTAYENSGLIIAMEVAAAFSERVIAPALWTRDQEDAADRLGADIVIAADYNIDAAFDVLVVMARLDEMRRQRQAAQREAQGAAFGKELEDSLKSGDGSSFVSTALVGFAKMGKTLVGGAMDAIGGGGYYSAEERVERLRAYIKRNHRYAPRNDLVVFPWNDGKNPLAAVMRNYAAASNAISAVDEGRVDEAVAFGRDALRPPTETDALPAISLALALAEKGDRAGMYRALARATESSEPAFAVYSAMIGEQLAGRNFDEAVRLMSEARKRLGDQPYLWPVRIALLAAAGRKLEAFATVVRCRLEVPDMAATCNAALGGVETVATRLGDGVAAKTPKPEAEPRVTPVNVTPVNATPEAEPGATPANAIANIFRALSNNK